MEFLKKHYEKILLSVVLIGLAVAVAKLPSQIQQLKENIAEKQRGIEAQPHPYKPRNLSTNEAALADLKQKRSVVLAGAHNTFNPVQWQRTPDGGLLKIVSGEEVGLAKLQITAIMPLHTVITFERTSGKSYSIMVAREAAVDPKLRKPTRRYVSQTSSNVAGFFTLQGIKGPVTAPEELTLELHDTKETAALSTNTNTPFKRVDGFLFDATYPPENRTFTGVRKDDVIGFNGDEYKVVDITPDSVVLFNEASQKRVTKKFTPAPSTRPANEAPGTAPASPATSTNKVSEAPSPSKASEQK